MKIGNRNVKVLKKLENKESGIRYEMTRKMMVNGKIGYFLVITNMRTGNHLKISRPLGIQEAYAKYMRATGIDLKYGIA